MKKSKVGECIRAFRETGTLTDVQGSYTGVYRQQTAAEIMQKSRDDERSPLRDAEELRPVQDADDL